MKKEIKSEYEKLCKKLKLEMNLHDKYNSHIGKTVCSCGKPSYLMNIASLKKLSIFLENNKEFSILNLLKYLKKEMDISLDISDFKNIANEKNFSMEDFLYIFENTFPNKMEWDLAISMHKDILDYVFLKYKKNPKKIKEIAPTFIKNWDVFKYKDEFVELNIPINFPCAIDKLIQTDHFKRMDFLSSQIFLNIQDVDDKFLEKVYYLIKKKVTLIITHCKFETFEKLLERGCFLLAYLVNSESALNSYLIKFKDIPRRENLYSKEDVEFVEKKYIFEEVSKESDASNFSRFHLIGDKLYIVKNLH